MSAPLLGSRGVVQLLVVVPAVLLAATLLATAPSPASARDHGTGGKAATYDNKDLQDRGDLEGVDAPKLPRVLRAGPLGYRPAPVPAEHLPPQRPTILLWGDSHAYEWIPALRERTRALSRFLAGSVADMNRQRR